MKKVQSKIPFNYITIKTTKSRIEKGLLAIPVSLIDVFPKKGSTIVLLNEKGKEEIKNFTPYKSSSRECRIGGLKKFYDKYQVKDGDELVIQVIDDGKYKLLPEKVFETKVNALCEQFIGSKNESEANLYLKNLTMISNITIEETIRNQFVLLSKKPMTKRKMKVRKQIQSPEIAFPSLRKLLSTLYEGKCQISNFTFITKKGKPYFEIHHIKPHRGNHIKNLLVVSPNVHAQFTYASVKEKFDNDDWLRKVWFNGEPRSVFQIIDKLPAEFIKEVHFHQD